MITEIFFGDGAESFKRAHNVLGEATMLLSFEKAATKECIAELHL
jgi:hypothetical protein